MAVLLQTTLGELIIDLYIDEVPILAANFLKLCKIKYYNNSLFHSVEKNFIARTGLPHRTKQGLGFLKDFQEESILGVIRTENLKAYKDVIQGYDAFWKPKYVDSETGRLREMFHPRLRHDKKGVVSMANERGNQIGSSFFITLRDTVDYLDGVRSVIGVVAEGLDVLEKLNNVIVEDHISNRPLQAVRILHAVVLDDPFPDPPGLLIPPQSPEVITDGDGPTEKDGAAKESEGGLIESEIATLEKIAKSEAKSRAVALEILGDLPDADLAPPDNVLFVCKLNPVTEADDLELIFSRFGKILSCDIIRDWKTGDSLQYGFIEFEDPKACEAALFKMEGCLIDDRRIHVDFCQSVSKQWRAYQLHGPRQQQQQQESFARETVPLNNTEDDGFIHTKTKSKNHHTKHKYPKSLRRSPSRSPTEKRYRPPQRLQSQRPDYSPSQTRRHRDKTRYETSLTRRATSFKRSQAMRDASPRKQCRERRHHRGPSRSCSPVRNDMSSRSAYYRHTERRSPYRYNQQRRIFPKKHRRHSDDLSSRSRSCADMSNSSDYDDRRGAPFR